MIPAAQESPEHSTPRLLAALMLTAMLTPLNSTMIAVALPAIAERFAVADGVVTTWLVTTYLIVNIALVSPAGRLGDLFGRRAALRAGQGIFAAGALAGGLSPMLGGVVAGRILMAVGGAIVIPATMAVIRGSVVPARRARVFATLGSLMGLAAAVGPVLGGLLTARAGWQAIFLVNAPLLLIAAVLARKLPATRTAEAAPRAGGGIRRLDPFGLALLTAGLAAGAVGLKLPAVRVVLVGVAAALLVAFVVWERRAAEPLIALELFRRRPLMAGATVIGLQNLSMYALMFQLPFLLEDHLGIGPERGGLVLLTMMGAMIVTAPVGGRLSERIGVRATVIAGLLVGAAGLGVALGGLAQASLPPLLVCLAAMGLGLGFVMGPNQAAALSSVATRDAGVASGLLSTIRYLGGLIGVSVIAVLLDHGDGVDSLATHRLCLWIYLGAHAVALGLAVVLPSHIGARVEDEAAGGV